MAKLLGSRRRAMTDLGVFLRGPPKKVGFLLGSL